MRWTDILWMSFTILRTNFLRSLLTILAIATAIGLIVVLVGLGYGVQDITIGSIIRSQSLLSLEVTPGENNIPPLTATSPERFATYPGVQTVTPVLSTVGQISYGGKLISNAIKAGQNSLIGMEGIELQAGRAYVDGKAEILVSPQALSLLDVSQEEILGKLIDLSLLNPTSQEKITLPEPVKVVGVTTSDTAEVYLPYSLITPFKEVTMTSVKILATDRNGVEEAQASIRAQGFTVDTLLDTLDQANQVFRWINFGLMIIALIALVVAAIGMFNTLTITLLERTREIGIMKSVGVTDANVLQLFLTEAGIIGLLGGIAGVVLGLLTALIFNVIVNHVATHFGGSALGVFRYPTIFLPAMVLFPVLLGILTGLYPALRAARLNSLVALRYE